MQTCLECLPCIIAQSKAAICRVIAERRRQEAVMREVMEALAINHWHLSPPYLVQKVHQIIRKWSGTRDPYLDAKRAFNQIALEMLGELETQVQCADDPFEMAVRVAIAGNIIDLGIVPDLNQKKLETTIEQAKSETLAVNDLNFLRKAATEAKRILYLGDNAGEIVFDRLLLGRLPLDKVTFVVRGAPILNDATREDAKEAGLTRLVRVLDNGSDVPGTIPDMCSLEFREQFEQADLIIAKGQGNYETLGGDPPPNIFFLLKAKCPIVAADLGAPPGGLVVKRGGGPRGSNGQRHEQACEMRQPS